MNLNQLVTSRNNNFNLIRLFLALLVIYGHSFHLSKIEATDHISLAILNFAPTVTVGGLAVQIFFFLSGIFVTASYYRNPNPFSFAFKRVARLFPGLFFCLLITLTLGCFASSTHSFYEYIANDEFYRYVFSNLHFSLIWDVQGVFSENKVSTINGSIHTLPLEFKMYTILLVIGLFGFVKNKSFFLLVILVLSLTLLIDKQIFNFQIYDMPYSKYAGACFFIGVISFIFSRRIKINFILPIMFLSLAIYIPAGLFKTLFFYAFIFLFVLYLGSITSKKYIFNLDPSYGVYLYGWPIQQLTLVVLPNLSPSFLFFVASPISIFMGTLSWIFFERPFIKFIHLFLDRKVDKNYFDFLAFHSKSVGILMAIFFVVFTFSYSLKNTNLIITSMDTTLTDFGPHSVKQGGTINLQKNGDSALWVNYIGRPPKGSYIVFNGKKLDTVIGDDGVATAVVPDSELSKRGKKEFFLENNFISSKSQSNKLIFEVN